ncbi:MAG TPA: hypothetical protein VGN52_13295 [Burkholderiales bacterium]
MNTANNPTRHLWEPWMAWLDYGASLGDAAITATQSAAPQAATVAPGAPQPLPFALMGADKMQAMGEGMLGMLSPMVAGGGALSLKLAQNFWQEWMRNLRFLQGWSPLAFAGPPSTWAQWPMEAATTAMSDAMQQGNYLAASTQDAADSAAEVTRAATGAARRGTEAVRKGVRATARKATHATPRKATRAGSGKRPHAATRKPRAAAKRAH